MRRCILFDLTSVIYRLAGSAYRLAVPRVVLHSTSLSDPSSNQAAYFEFVWTIRIVCICWKGSDISMGTFGWVHNSRPQFQTVISCEGFRTIPWINQDNIDQVTFEIDLLTSLNQFQHLKFGLLTTDLFSNKLVWKYYPVVCWITQQQHFPNTWFQFKLLFACKSCMWKLYRHCNSQLSQGRTNTASGYQNFWIVASGRETPKFFPVHVIG